MTAESAQTPPPGNGTSPLRTVVVLGVSYGGGHATKLLASGLPEGWRVVAIDRNSHFNHQYVFPRFIALPEHAPKAFVPYQNLLKLPPAPEVEPEPGSPASFQVTQKRGVKNGPHRFINGRVSHLDKHAVTVQYADGGEETIPFEYCIYALGAILPAPCDVWGENELGRGTKAGAVAWMQRQKGVIQRAPRILVVGGGALGIQFATDIKNIYPEKEVTLVHSRTRILPRYPQEMHDAAIEGLERLGVRVFLGHRVVSWPSTPCMEEGSEKVVRTDSGQTFTADLVLACTGTKANSKLMAAMEPGCVNPSNGRIAVRHTTQVKRFDLGDEMEGLRVGEAHPPKEGEVAEDKDADLDHMFAIGDCADTPAIQAGHVSYYQGVVAVKNILKMIQREKGAVNGTADGAEKEAQETEPLDLYTPTPPMLKLTLGLKHYATAMPDGVTLGDDGVEDLAARVMWGVYHADEMPDDA